MPNHDPLFSLLLSFYSKLIQPSPGQVAESSDDGSSKGGGGARSSSSASLKSKGAVAAAASASTAATTTTAPDTIESRLLRSADALASEFFVLISVAEFSLDLMMIQKNQRKAARERNKRKTQVFFVLIAFRSFLPQTHPLSQPPLPSPLQQQQKKQSPTTLHQTASPPRPSASSSPPARPITSSASMTGGTPLRPRSSRPRSSRASHPQLLPLPPPLRTTERPPPRCPRGGSPRPATPSSPTAWARARSGCLLAKGATP